MLKEKDKHKQTYSWSKLGSSLWISAQGLFQKTAKSLAKKKTGKRRLSIPKEIAKFVICFFFLGVVILAFFKYSTFLPSKKIAANPLLNDEPGETVNSSQTDPTEMELATSSPTLNQKEAFASGSLRSPVQNPDGHEKNRFSLWGSFIYWQARQDNMDVALISHSPSIVNSCCGMSWKGAKRLSIKPPYEPGFQVGAEFIHRQWGTFFDVTSYGVHRSLSRNAPSGGFLFARWIQPGLVTDNEVSSLRTSWKLRMNVFHLGTGRKSHWGKHLILQPHFGACVAQIDQSFKGHFFLTQFSPLKARNKSDSWGLGPRAGILWDWQWNRRWGIVGNVAAGILYTWYDLDLDQKAPNDSTVFIRTSDKVEVLRPELEIDLGLKYTFLVSKKVEMYTVAGYDFQVWWNQNMIRWNNDTTFVSAPEGNLYLQGFQFSLGMAF